MQNMEAGTIHQNILYINTTHIIPPPSEEICCSDFVDVVSVQLSYLPWLSTSFLEFSVVTKILEVDVVVTISAADIDLKILTADSVVKIFGSLCYSKDLEESSQAKGKPTVRPPFSRDRIKKECFTGRLHHRGFLTTVARLKQRSSLEHSLLRPRCREQKLSDRL